MGEEELGKGILGKIKHVQRPSGTNKAYSGNSRHFGITSVKCECEHLIRKEASEVNRADQGRPSIKFVFLPEGPGGPLIILMRGMS